MLRWSILDPPKGDLILGSLDSDFGLSADHFGDEPLQCCRWGLLLAAGDSADHSSDGWLQCCC